MKRSLFGIIAIAGLALTLIPAMLVFNGSASMDKHRTLMGIGMLLWFVAAPNWMRRDK